MLIHIGSDTVIDLEDMILIFDYKKLKESKHNRLFLEKVSEKAIIIGSKQNIASCIVASKESKEIIYCSPISCSTLLKRVNNIG